MLAYYGQTDKWVGIDVRLTHEQPRKTKLYCQVPGCGKEITGWCLAQAKLDVTKTCILALPTHEPAIQKAWDEAVARVDKKREKGERERKKEEKKREKER